MSVNLLQQITLGMVFLADILIALYVLLKNPRHNINIFFFFFVLGAALCGFGILMLLTTKIFLFDRLVFYGGTFMMLSLVIFSKVFPDNQKIGKAIWWWLTPLFVFFVMIPFGFFVKGMTVQPDGSVKPILGPAFPVYIIASGAYMFFSLYLLGKKYFKTSGLKRLQMRYLFLGAAVFLASLFIFNVLLPGLGIVKFILVGPASTILLVCLTAYAIVRHQLMDIRVVIKRGLVYLLLLGLIVAVYWGAVFIIGYIFRDNPNLTVLMGLSVTAAFGIFSFAIIEKYFLLEERVKERTAQLEKLRQEERQMMIDVSHGLQTPLTIVKSQLDIVKRSNPTSGELKQMESSIDQISKFIYDLLRLAHLESGSKSFQKEMVDLSQLLEDLCDYFDVVAREKRIRLVKKIEPGITIFGEASQLREMVTNLVSNSMKYMAVREDPLIVIELRRENSNVVLIIKDNGIGIGKEDLPKIFNRFYRSENSRREGVAGTGLGLAITKKIVDMHQGTITAESQTGQGTKFTILLPC